jgi:dTDP-4-amino-4,6-dideoxygalactose transaminase
MGEILAARMKIVQAYMGSVPTVIQPLKIREGTEWNFSYFPLIFQNENELLRIQSNLNNCRIFPRRYFYPSLNNIQYLPNSILPISESIAKRIMCLPVFYGLSNIQTKKILNLLQN